MKKILIGIGNNLLKQIDDIARQEELSRSELVRQALRQFIKTKTLPESLSRPK